jgi:predicted esterase
MADAGVRTAFIALVLACVACHPARRHADPEPPATPAVAEPRTAVVDTGLPPLTNAPWLDRLDLEGGATAFVSVPLGAKEPRPIMVAAHGAGDRPEWACGAWRGVTQAYPFIICPRGTPTGDGRYYWSSTAELARVVDRAIVALRERFGAYVAPGPMLYAGFSAGAIYGAAFVRDRAADFPVILFAEGGYDQVADPRFAAQFKKNGGRRALLGCSTGAGCLGRFRQAAKVFERAGVRTRVNDAGFIGHNLRDEVVQSLRKDLPWLVSDAVGWPSAGSVTVPAPVSSTDAATTATHASTTAAPPDESPVGVARDDGLRKRVRRRASHRLFSRRYRDRGSLQGESGADSKRRAHRAHVPVRMPGGRDLGTSNGIQVVPAPCAGAPVHAEPRPGRARWNRLRA